MNSEKKRGYARLIARSGISIVPGQQVIIRTEPEQLDFLEILVEECYLAGAGRVDVRWRYTPLIRLDIKYQSDHELGVVPRWEEQRMKERVEMLPADIYLDSDDPDGLAGIDNEKWARAQRERYKILKPYRDAMENRYQWCVAGVPGVKWAQKVFPELPTDLAVERLWEAVLHCGRADGEDPIADWEAHNTVLRRRCDKLNSLQLRRLIYSSENTGTKLSVGLMPQMLFMGGADHLVNKNVWFNANIPSEEVFTTPMKGEAEGIAYATRPLSYRGVLIEDFSVRFERGRAVEVHAAKNQTALELMISMDEGAAMLGECALVPFQSPIRNSGIMFYSTLFDENASCHLALGDGYSSCLKNAGSYTPEQARAMGVNDSIIHEDFMIGSSDLNITGICADGASVPIFVNGEWAVF